jgi:hypothetical protein
MMDAKELHRLQRWVRGELERERRLCKDELASIIGEATAALERMDEGSNDVGLGLIDARLTQARIASTKASLLADTLIRLETLDV